MKIKGNEKILAMCFLTFVAFVAGCLSFTYPGIETNMIFRLVALVLICIPSVVWGKIIYSKSEIQTT